LNTTTENNERLIVQGFQVLRFRERINELKLTMCFNDHEKLRDVEEKVIALEGYTASMEKVLAELEKNIIASVDLGQGLQTHAVYSGGTIEAPGLSYSSGSIDIDMSYRTIDEAYVQMKLITRRADALAVVAHNDAIDAVNASVRVLKEKIEEVSGMPMIPSKHVPKNKMYWINPMNWNLPWL